MCFRVCAFGGQEHILNHELQEKYGYCLEDLNDMVPFKADTKVDAKVTQVSS